MITHVNFEMYSPAMKARIDPVYRRALRAEQQPKNVKFWKKTSRNDRKTVLPFTTKTRSYGTYAWGHQ